MGTPARDGAGMAAVSATATAPRSLNSAGRGDACCGAATVIMRDPLGQQVQAGGNAGKVIRGVTSIGLGVRAGLPFRVLALKGPDQQSQLVIDVAYHR